MFKKITFVSAVLAAAFGFSSCSSDSATDSFEEGELVAAQSAIKSKLAGSMLLNETPLAEISVQQQAYHWQDAVDIIKTFPEKETPQGVYHDFTFVSNGEPFDLVMLYSNGGYRHKLYIYWYDEENECHNQLVWNELDEKESGSQQTWYNANGGKSTQISRVSDNAGAYKIQLPKGTRFGFYQESYKQDNGGWVIVTEGVRLQKFGPIEACPYRFYTEYAKNWNTPFTQDMQPSGQAMTTAINGWTVVGFEDISLTYPSCDKDYNDVVFALNPVQRTNVDPTPEIVDGSVETNLSVSEENGTDKVKFSIHVRAVTDFEVVLPVVDKVLADDFAIVAKHDVEWAYSDKLEIAGQTVTLNYSLTDEGYLKITSSGINDEIIQYCKSKYADGLTFESFLFFEKFDLKAQPTVTFTKNPTFYITSCVTNSPEAQDIEVVWDEKAINAIDQLDFETTNGDFIYDHEVYSPYDVTELKDLGWIKEKQQPDPAND